MENLPSLPNDSSTCTGSLHPQAVAGLHLFNAGEYFEAHEALETAWREEAGPARELYRGVLQVAVAYYHLTRGNYIGTLKMFARARYWLALFPERCRGIEVGRLMADAQAVEAEVRRLGPNRLDLLDRAALKPVVWEK